MATFNTDIFIRQPFGGTGHGVYKNTTNLHAVTGTLPTSLATADIINIGYLPPNAVVTQVILKAQSQLDSSTGLALSMGVTGTPLLWKSSVTTVGRAAGVSGDSTIATAGTLYKNTSGAKLAVIVTVSTQATTAVAGVLEACVSYFVADAAGSNP